MRSTSWCALSFFVFKLLSSSFKHSKLLVSNECGTTFDDSMWKDWLVYCCFITFSCKKFMHVQDENLYLYLSIRNEYDYQNRIKKIFPPFFPMVNLISVRAWLRIFTSRTGKQFPYMGNGFNGGRKKDKAIICLFPFHFCSSKWRNGILCT